MTKTEICNVALSQVGTGKAIADFDTDQSQEAKACRTLFDSFMSTVLRGFNWNFAAVFVNVEPVVIYPNQEFNYGYRYPSDCLYVRRFWNGQHYDDRTNVINYQFTNDSQGRLILSDFGPSSALTSQTVPTTPTTTFTVSAGDTLPVLEYTQKFADISFVPDDFIWAFSLMLAGWLGPLLPNIGTVDMRAKNLQLGSIAMQAAMARDQNEARPTLRKTGELTKSRVGSRINFGTVGFQTVKSSFTP